MLLDFKRSGEKDLDYAIDEIKKLTTLNQKMDAYTTASILNTLSELLCTRFKQTRSIDDLESAIKASKEAIKVQEAVETSTLQASCFNNYGIALFGRFNMTGST